jgi:hypothetical protein
MEGGMKWRKEAKAIRRRGVLRRLRHRTDPRFEHFETKRFHAQRRFTMMGFLLGLEAETNRRTSKINKFACANLRLPQSNRVEGFFFAALISTNSRTLTGSCSAAPV